MSQVQVAVCGPGDCTRGDARLARRIGELLASRGAVVLCGGGGGVMAEAAAGARSRGGLAIGIHPGSRRGAASADLSASVITNMGEARNAIIVRSADALIAVGGSWGTLSEIALAVRRGDLSVISVGGWRIVSPSGAVVPGVVEVATAEEAVVLALGTPAGE